MTWDNATINDSCGSRKEHTFSGNYTGQEELADSPGPGTLGAYRCAGSPADSRGGVEAVREADRALGLTRALEAGIGPIEERDRGLTTGQLLESMSSAPLTGADVLVGLNGAGPISPASRWNRPRRRLG
jgi:hypothetical protein